MDQQQQHQDYHPGAAMRFFVFCSAANVDVLRRCPSSEHHKYASIGATVFFTGMLAALSGGYALFTVFRQVWVAVVLGIFWGMLIFNLDRFIVSTLKRSGGRLGQALQALPRLLLAVFLAIVISKPLELRIFEQEIQESLHDTGLRKLEAADVAYDHQIAVLQQKIQALHALAEARYEQREKYYEAYKCECEGTCGTGARGVGSECLRKERKYQQADEEYQALLQNHQRQEQQLEADIRKINADRGRYKEALAASFSDGLLARLEALHKLPAGPSWAIVLLLIFIEVSPVLAKVLAPKGPYDHVLKSIEYDYEVEELSSISVRNQKLNHQLTVLAGVEQEKMEQELLQSRETLHRIERAHQEILQEQLDIWVDQEKARLREQAYKTVQEI